MSQSRFLKRCPLCSPDDRDAVRPARGLFLHLVQAHELGADEAREVADSAPLVSRRNWLEWWREESRLLGDIEKLKAQLADATGVHAKRLAAALDAAVARLAELSAEEP